MPVPKQVQDQADAADKMLKDKEESKKGKTELGEDGKPLVPAPEDDKGPQAGDEPIPDDKNKDQGAKPPVEDETFEQKYKVLKGKYDSEGERYRSEIAQLKQETAELRQKTMELINLMKEAESDKKAKTKEPPKLVKAADYMSEKEIEGFKEAGYDESDLDILATLSVRAAEEAAKANVKPLASDVQKLSQNAAVSKSDRFWDSLNKAVSDWEKLQKEPEFGPFILSKAPYQNGTRQQVLDAAAKRLDSKTAIEIYSDYLKTKTPAPQEPTPQKQNLKKQLEPGSGLGGSPPVEGKIYTPADIKKFYDDVSKGVYRNRPEEAEKIDKDILLASSQGRVRPSK